MCLPEPPGPSSSDDSRPDPVRSGLAAHQAKDADARPRAQCVFPQHQRLLRASAVVPEVGRERGHVSADLVRLQVSGDAT
jgi:hypothetical protein